MSPLITTVLSAVVLMLASLFIKNKRNISILAIVLMAVLLGVNIYELCHIYRLPGQSITFFNGQLSYQPFNQWLNVLISGLTLFYLLISSKHIERVGQHTGEYYALIFFILVGANLLSGFGTLLIMFLGIEILSIPQYILAGSDKENLKSSEASLKYFLMGAFTTGLLLMGIALLYGAMGTFNIADFDFMKGGEYSILGMVGIVFVILAFGFKVSAAPMHFWTPDVYDGAPVPFTSFMATIAKSAAFIGFIHLFINSFAGISAEWQYIIVFMILATLLIGNFTALYQLSVKRMLAYSSIAQAGFMLFAILASNQEGWDSIIIYTFAYSIATICIFSVVMKVKDYTYDGFNGFARKEPYVALVMTICLASLAGIPLTAGFFAKFFVLRAALITQPDMLWLIILALVLAALSVYYYFKLIMAMYFKKGEAELQTSFTNTDKMMLTIGAAAIIVVGFAPDILFWWK